MIPQPTKFSLHLDQLLIVTYHLAVSIASHAETVSPLVLGKEKEIDDLDLDRVSEPRQFRAKGPSSKRLSGRRSHNPSISSLHSIVEKGDGGLPQDDDEDKSTDHDHHLFNSGLVGQVTSWIREERAKRHARKSTRGSRTDRNGVDHAEGEHDDHGHNRRGSASSMESVDLSKLEQIIKESLSFDRSSKRRGSVLFPRKRPSVKDLHRASSSRGGASSDTDYHEGDVLVPSAEAWLDNTKTLAYTGGGASESSDNLTLTETSKSRDAWATFKYEIVRLTHTLRLKGWRRVPMEMSSEIEVERLSGALTNAVYVVSPPSDLPQQRPSSSASTDEVKVTARPPPPRLLLRIYGPQVEHLIDREAELQILRRLARKHIGPRLLGTFNNGRFEEFFHARALTPNELRNPDTSKHIAKRMRELHDGVDLLERERDEGAFVWRNWDKWQQRVENVVSWLDSQILQQKPGAVNTGSDAWKSRGLVCGTEWAVFKRALEKYRVWLEAQYGQPAQLRQRYVFAHNDVSFLLLLISSNLTISPDSIWQHPAPPSHRHLAPPAPGEHAQTTHRHRLRVRFSQHPRSRIRKPLYRMVLQLPRPIRTLAPQRRCLPHSGGPRPLPPRLHPPPTAIQCLNPKTRPALSARHTLYTYVCFCNG